jgi:hypothetical protein
MVEEGDGRGLSAAGARRITKRAKRESSIAKPAHYVVTLDGEEHHGTFKTVAQLCPTVIASTLKRRLEIGERDIRKLRRAPEPKQGVRKRRGNKHANYGKNNV